MNDTLNVGTEEGAACALTRYAAEYLREIANGGDPEHYWCWLCYNLSFALSSRGYQDPCGGYAIIEKYAPLWPEFSGDAGYPVRCDMYEVDGQCPWYDELYLWVGEYGAARRRLAGFIADELERSLG